MGASAWGEVDDGSAAIPRTVSNGGIGGTLNPDVIRSMTQQPGVHGLLLQKAADIAARANSSAQVEGAEYIVEDAGPGQVSVVTGNYEAELDEAEFSTLTIAMQT